MNRDDKRANDLADELAGHIDFVRRMARALVRDDHVAEDVVQETMMAAVAHRPNPSLGLRVWLTSVLRRRVLLHFRTEQRRVARETLLVTERKRASSAPGGEALRALESIERTSMLGRSVASLPDPYRTVVVLRFFDGLSPKRISERLDRPVSTVNTQLQRGLERLRRSLDDENDGDRRAWITALLPEALHGRQGWWPASVGGASGISYGILAQLAALVVGLVATGTFLLLSDPAENRVESVTPDTTAGVQQAATTDWAGRQDSRRPNGDAAVRPTERIEPAVTQVEEDRSPVDGGSGLFRLTVRSQQGAVEGALVTAEPRSAEALKLVSPASEIKRGDGAAFDVESAIQTGAKPAGAVLERRVETAATNENGVALLSIVDGQRWTIHVKAEGYASESLIVNRVVDENERSVRLVPAARLVVDRGTFPLETLVFVQLTCRTNGYLRSERMMPGDQELEFTALQPARWELVAQSDAGEIVGQWFQTLSLEQGLVTHLDLSEGGAVQAVVEITGYSEAAEPEFIQVHGPLAERGAAGWSYVAPVTDGLAELHGLPPGPANVRALVGNAEIGRGAIETLPGVASQRFEIKIPGGAIRALHPGISPKDIEWSLALQSGSAGSSVDWSTLGGALPGDEKSLFLGCAPGDYRLWMFYRGAAQSFDVRVEGGVVDVDTTSEASSQSSIDVLRGPGAKNGGPVEIEVYPGTWHPIDVTSGKVSLSHGRHRIRCGLEGLGRVTREVDVPIDKSVAFEEAAPRRSFPVVVPGAEERLWLQVVLVDPSASGPPDQQLVLVIAENGEGAVNLRPGRYVVSDRRGRSATVDVGADPKTIRLVLR